MTKESRRRFIKAGVAVGLATAATYGEGSLDGYGVRYFMTPSEIEGPFYPVTQQKDKDFDLTRIDGHSQTAQGKVIEIHGKVIDTSGSPLEDASVELWQANTHGRYRHPSDSSKAPLDPHFQGWAVVPTGPHGNFRFKTIFPGTYKVGPKWTRPPHIHFKIAKSGYSELVTQMYFPENPLNDVDHLLQRKGKEEQLLMIAKQRGRKSIFDYQIVLQRS